MCSQPVSSVRTVRQIPTHRSSQFRATITQWHIFVGLSSESFPSLLHLQSLPLLSPSLRLSLFSPSTLPSLFRSPFWFLFFYFIIFILNPFLNFSFSFFYFLLCSPASYRSHSLSLLVPVVGLYACPLHLLDVLKILDPICCKYTYQ